MHPICRLRSNDPSWVDLLLGIRHLPPHRSRQRRQQALELGLCKTLPNTASGTMEEGHVGEIAARTSRVSCSWLQPALGHELVGIRAPEIRAAVDSPWYEHDTRPGGDVLVHAFYADGRVADCGACTEGHGRIEPESFVDDCVEDWKRFYVGCCGWSWARK